MSLGVLIICIQSLALFQPVIHREDARLETEGIPSKILSVYDNSQLKAGDFLHVNLRGISLPCTADCTNIIFFIVAAANSRHNSRA